MTKNDLTNLIESKKEGLLVTDLFFSCNPKVLLQAIAQNESSYGIKNIPRFESTFYIGGAVYKNSKEVQNLVAKYGKMAAASHSSWQILFVTAFELGFNGPPDQLNNDAIAIDYVIKFINKRIFNQKPRELGEIFSSYNSGYLHPPSAFVEHYVAEGISNYMYYLNGEEK